MQRREFLKAAALGAATLALPRLGRAAQAGKPNIIFVLADDVGLPNISCYGGDAWKTPLIDKLAASGIRFDYGFSEPLCGPTRAQLMTGRYACRNGVTTNGQSPYFRPENEIMIPRVLKPAGYVTAQAGKWNQLPLLPGDWGFDEYCYLKGMGKYWASQDPTYLLSGKEMPVGDKYVPDLLHEFVTDFMKRHKDQPFFIYYAMESIHAPILKTPDSKPDANEEQLYTDNNNTMDKLVGRLVASLEQLGLREKTLLIFMGDNGTARFGSDKGTLHGKKISGMKGTMLEGGVRVPLIASWPGTTPAGKVNEDLLDLTDFMATFAELAGTKLPEGVKYDGHSIAPQLRGEQGTPREWVFVQLGLNWYVRDRKWKLTQDGALFDMSNAPYEEKPVAAGASEPEITAARKRLQAVLDELNPAAGKQSGPAVIGKKKKAKKKAGTAPAGGKKKKKA